MLLELLAILFTWLLIQALSSFGFPGALTLLVVAFVALVWGSGPSILATLLGVALIDYILLPPTNSWFVNGSDLIGLGIFLLVGLVISRLASQNAQTKRAAEMLTATLERERARLQAILEAIPDPITFYDAQGTLQGANSVSLEFIGERSLPAALETLPQVFHIRTAQGAPFPVEQLPVARALRGESVSGVEVVTPAADGRDRVLLTGAAPIRNRQGQIEGAVATTHDVTALRRAEQEAARRHKQLQAQLALTDTALTHLALDDLLRELLNRLREVMGLDNAAILLLGEDGQMLHMRAAHGLEEEVAANVHIPVGEGFAGRIAASRAPLVVEDLSTFEVFNPFLKEKLRSVVGVPLLVGERVLGVAHVGTAAPRQFTEEEVQLLQRAADRIALAVDRAAVYAAAEQARAEAEQHAGEFEAIFESMTDGVFVLNAQGGIRRVNTFAQEILGSEESNWQGRSMEERFSYLLPRDLNHQVVPFERLPAQRVLQGEVLTGAQAVDLLYQKADGSTLVTSMSGKPLRNQSGTITGAVLVAHDVTERWRLERRTYASLEALLVMAEALVMPEPLPAEASAEFTAASLAHRVLELTCQVLGCANATYVSREGVTDVAHLVASVGFTPEQEELVRRSVEGTRFADRYTDLSLLARLHAGEIQVLDLEKPPYQDRRPLASLRQALVVPIRLGETLLGVMSLNQEQQGPVYTTTDRALAQGMGRLVGLILERERLLGEREEARAKVLALSETTRQMDAFLSIVSHELRTPVTAIKGSVQLLLKRGDVLAAGMASPEDTAALWSSQQQRLRRMEKQIARLTRLLEDLIDLSRVRSGKLEVQVQPCDLPALVAGVVEEEQLAHPDRTIQLMLPAGESVHVLADVGRTEQVLINYLTNALKYSPQKAPVEVGLAVEDGQTRVWVRDQGPGIPLDEQAQLWNLFHRVPGIEVQSGSGIGLGLGLYISKTMIERQGGQVGVDSQPGAGSTFWFTLPRTPKGD